MLVEHRSPLRLGGMGGQHRLDADFVKGLRNLLRRHPLVPEAAQFLRPQTGFVNRSVVDLAEPPCAGRCVLLNHVQQLEGNGEGLLETRDAPRLPANPRQPVSDPLQPHFQKNLPQAIHEKAEIFPDLLKP